MNLIGLSSDAFEAFDLEFLFFDFLVTVLSFPIAITN